MSFTHLFLNKSVKQYIFRYRGFHVEHVGDIYSHVRQLVPKLEGPLQPHISPFMPSPYPVLSQYIPFYEVRRNIKSLLNSNSHSSGCVTLTNKR